MSLSDAIINLNFDLVNKYIMKGIDLNVIDEYGFTPLIQAAIVNDLSIAKLLIQNHADVNLQDLTGNTALHWAVENANLALIELLLQHKADPNMYTKASQSVLVKSVMRNQSEIKNKLYEYGANLNFAKDFINTKLLGHRFELVGRVDIVDPANKFTELDYEGFFLEFSLSVIRNSLSDFKINIKAKDLRDYFIEMDKVIDALSVAAELVRYQQYHTNLSQVDRRIRFLLKKNDLQIIPIAHDGHATTLIYYRGRLIISDRKQDAQVVNALGVYQVSHPSAWNYNLLHTLIYVKKPLEFMNKTLPSILGLKLHSKLLMPAQISGNCSWANVEAAVPSGLYLLMRDPHQFPEKIIGSFHSALDIFYQWREWDRLRELQFCIDSFIDASPAARASKAAILGAILFQRLSAKRESDVAIARRILSVIDTPDYNYILESYKKVYCTWKQSVGGSNLIELLKSARDGDF